jgi:hypothetical protein
MKIPENVSYLMSNADEKKILSIIHFRIVFNIYDASETDIVLHISFRKDFNKIQLNSEVQGKFMQNKNAEGVAITSGSVAKLTVEVHQDAFKVRKLLFLARALICSFK